MKEKRIKTGLFLAGCLVTASALAAGHWAPWWKTLHRVCAYIYGVASILLGAFVWLVLQGKWREWLGMCALSASGGATVVLAYAYDKAANRCVNAPRELW